MKKMLLVLVVLAILASPALAEGEKPPMILGALSITAGAAMVTHGLLAYDWAYNYGGKVGYPFWRPAWNDPVDMPVMGVTIDVGAAIGLYKASEFTWKKNKVVGYLLPLAVLVIESLAIRSQLQNRAKWRG